MKRLVIAVLFATGLYAAVEAAPTDVVTKADLQVLIQRIAQLEAQNQAQAARIAELEKAGKRVESVVAAQVAQGAKASESPKAVVAFDEGTTTNESGRIYTTAQGFKYYLADKAAGIFEPLSESGLKITPYGYLAFEAVHNTRGTEVDVYTDWVKSPRDRGYNNHTTTLSMQDSILGLQFETPESYKGWTFTGRAEFDLAGDHGNDYAFHWRHLYVNAEHESGWSILFGQTWHLWKMITPSSIDGAWMENTGYPYRRSPQLRVTKKWDFEDSSLEFRIGMVKGGPGMGGDRDSDGTQDNSASAWPLFESALLFERDAGWQESSDNGGKRWMVGIAGMYGRDKSRRVEAWDEDGNPDVLGQSEEFDSSLGMFAAKVPFWDFTLTGQIFAGQNLGGIQAGIGQRVGYDAHGNGRAVRTIGGLIDLAYQLNDDWSFAIGYGFDNPDDDDAKYAAGRLYNDRAYIDAFYQITSNFRLGLEYARLSTKWHDEGTGYDDRIQFSALYDF